MKTQTQTETQTEAEQRPRLVSINSRSTHSLPAHAPLYGHGQWLNASSDSESDSESEWGRQAPHARIVARPRPRPWPLSSRHLSHASISDLRSSLSALSALLGSALCLSCLHVDSLRRFSDPEVAEFAQAGPRSRSIFMASSGNWR